MRESEFAPDHWAGRLVSWVGDGLGLMRGLCSRAGLDRIVVPVGSVLYDQIKVFWQDVTGLDQLLRVLPHRAQVCVEVRVTLLD